MEYSQSDLRASVCLIAKAGDRLCFIDWHMTFVLPKVMLVGTTTLLIIDSSLLRIKIYLRGESCLSLMTTTIPGTLVDGLEICRAGKTRCR